MSPLTILLYAQELHHGAIRRSGMEWSRVEQKTNKQSSPPLILSRELLVTAANTFTLTFADLRACTFIRWWPGATTERQARRQLMEVVVASAP